MITLIQLQKTMLLAAGIGLAASLPPCLGTAYSADLSQLSPTRTKKYSKPGLPLSDTVLENFIGSSKCSFCHSDLTDKSGADMSITNHWRSTMMANAAKDPLWLAKVKSEVARNPHLAKVIEEKCVSCHMPMAYRQMKTLPDNYRLDTGVSIFDHFTSPESTLHEAAMDGISCSLCHQIQDKGLGSNETFSGKFILDTETPAPERALFGPYKKTEAQTMRTAIGFTPTYGPQMNDATLCAACHTLYTPYVDAKGDVVGEFPEQTVYLEWLNSIYGEPAGTRHEIGETKGDIRICQECHMPHSESGGVIIAKPAKKETEKRDHFSQHHFVGGNVFMLNILMDNPTFTKVSAPTSKFVDTRNRTLNLLTTKTADLSITKLRHRGDTIEAAVKVENSVGHKFPTGIPTRRTWIHLTVTDASRNIIFDSGKPLENGGIMGNDADQDLSRFEPHYDTITSADQVQIYESVMKNTDNEVTYTLLRGAGYLKDNRLLPKGFEQQNINPDIAVYGKALEDNNFTGGSDTVNYVIPLNSAVGPFTVSAELLYSAVSLAFMNDLAHDNSIKEVKQFSKFYDKADKMPVVVAAVQEKTR
ncbi:MAG: cytochrome c family protein [Desulfocapsa sp.]|nr:cytochrome c family protein [Desulfocapsa sp.]